MEEASAREVLAGNWDALLPFYAEDVVFLPPNQPEIRGRAALLELLRHLPPVMTYDVRVDEIEGCGDLAYAKGSYALSLRPDSGTPPVRDTGRFLHILRKRADGSWLITRDIFSSDRSAEPAR